MFRPGYALTLFFVLIALWSHASFAYIFLLHVFYTLFWSVSPLRFFVRVFIVGALLALYGVIGKCCENTKLYYGKINEFYSCSME